MFIQWSNNIYLLIDTDIFIFIFNIGFLCLILLYIDNNKYYYNLIEIKYQ